MLGSLNTRVLKEPRGFMKVLQFIFSICAFATTTSFSTYFTFIITCLPSDVKANVTITNEISYPFQIDRIRTQFTPCDRPVQTLYIEGDFSSDARFFVAIGVLAFLYALVAIVLYCFFTALYENNDLVPIGDFGVHVLLVLLWFAASCAWASSLSGLRSAASLDVIISGTGICNDLTCSKVREPRFGKLISSVILGFLNTFLWGSNLWFLYKETRFYKDRKGVEAEGGSNLPA